MGMPALPSPGPKTGGAFRLRGGAANSIFGGMKWKRFLILLAAAFFAFRPLAFAQDTAAQAAALAEKREAEERYKALAAQFENLGESYAALQKRMSSLENEMAALRDAVQTERSDRLKAALNYATRDDLKTLLDKITREIDQKRESDKRLIMEEIGKIARIASKPIILPAPPENRPPPEPKSEPSGEFYTHVVREGETLSAIINAYNTRLKAEGKGRVTLDQVKKSNPKMDPERVIVGREILIPVPASK